MTSRHGPRRQAQSPGPLRAADALRLVTEALVDRKALEPVVLDLRGLTAATDYFVIASGTSDAHVRGMAEHLMTALAPRGIEPHHVEGLPQGRWVLLDYVDFVVHIFSETARKYYDLERLWKSARKLEPAELAPKARKRASPRATARKRA